MGVNYYPLEEHIPLSELENPIKDNISRGACGEKILDAVFYGILDPYLYLHHVLVEVRCCACGKFSLWEQFQHWTVGE